MHDRLTRTQQTHSLKGCHVTTSDYGEFFNEQYKYPISLTTNYTKRIKTTAMMKNNSFALSRRLNTFYHFIISVSHNDVILNDPN